MDSKFGSVASGVVPSCSEGDQFCRLCFSDDQQSEDELPLKPLFPEDGRPDRDLLWKILECTTLKLTFDDDHPAKVCHRCIVRMDDFCDYRLAVLRNDKRVSARRLEPKRILEVPPAQPPKEQLQNYDHEDPLESFSAEYVDEGEFEDDEAHRTAVVKEEFALADEDRALLEFSLDDTADAANSEDEEESGNDESQLLKSTGDKRRRTRKILMFEDHAYLLLSSRPKSDSITWACYYRKALNCRATIGTKADGQILGYFLPTHDHPPTPLETRTKRKTFMVHAYRVVSEVYLGDYEIVRSRMGGDILMYDGDRYPYSHSRMDGCRIWKCGSHRGCTVSIYMGSDGKIYKMSNSEHTKVPKQSKHRASDVVGLAGEEKGSLSDVSSNIEKAFPNPTGTFNYKIVKNTNKRNVLIYEGDRYCFYYKKTNGWTVWRCTVSKACQAMLYQLANESVAVLGETIHNHLNASGGTKRRRSSDD